MHAKDLIPNWFRGKRDLPIRRDDNLTTAGLGRDFENLLEDMFRDFANDSILPRLFKGETPVNISPKMDISETDKEYVIEADMPGVKEKDIDIFVSKDRLLTIKGRRETKEEENKRDYHRIERSYGSFERSLYLPENCNIDDINATLTDGIVNLRISKKKADEQSIRKIQVNK